MSWLDRLLGRRTQNSPQTSATRRPLYIPHDAPKSGPDSEDTEKLAQLKLLEDSKLASKEVDDGRFDPYNTGAFNRSRSWDKISKHKSR